MNRPNDKYYDAKKVLCPQCRKLLCKRLLMHNEEEEAWCIEVKHRKLEILMVETIAIFTCPSCGKKVRINSKKGIEAQWPTM